MKRFAVISAAIFFLVLSTLAGRASAADSNDGDRPPLVGLEKVESIVYGSPGTGGLLLRLSKVERDLFGMELPGSLTERQTALENFVEKGGSGQPSLLFKAAIAEWVTQRRVNTSMAFTERVDSLELTLEGEPQAGPLSARLERLISKLMPNGVSAEAVTVPASTVIKSKFVNTLTVRNVKKGDMVALEVIEDCVTGGLLVAATGNRLFAEVTRVRMPRSFGRPSEIEVEFRDIEFIDSSLAQVYIGPESKKAMELDSATIGAAGASVAGAVLLGPVGLAGGFLVRGSDKQVKEGTQVFVETTEASSIMGYRIPALELPNVVDTQAPSSPSGGESGVDVAE
ncbi:MAG: hypothetical protein LBL73_04055 [Synergistaceae bacterium]|jgi:hypothetical protein|nr:hypothetical protein [Synergistaceae bacterium]